MWTGEIKQVPYKVDRAGNGDVSINVDGKHYSPPEIAAMILQKLKQSAEDYLGSKVEQASNLDQGWVKQPFRAR